MNPLQWVKALKAWQQLRPAIHAVTDEKRGEFSRSPSAPAIAIDGDEHIAQLVKHVIYIPQAQKLLLPALEAGPCNSSPVKKPSAAAAPSNCPEI